MTALPQPGHLLTIADYAALGEDESHRWELLEGNLVMSPSPTPRHAFAMGELHAQLRPQIPDGYLLLLDVDVNLQLAPAARPATVRRPDLCVVTQAEFDRVGRDGGLLRTNEVALVVEIISPGSGRTDRFIKRTEYCDAGIESYWIIDLDPRPSLVEYRLADGYRDTAAVTGEFALDEPFAVRLQLDLLG